MSNLRKTVVSVFKFHGFTLKEDACKFLTEQLDPFKDNESEIDDWLNKIIEVLQNKSLEVACVRKEDIESVLNDCAKSLVDCVESVVSVINAFEIPRFYFSIERKKFMPVTSGKEIKLFDSAYRKSFLYRERYTILLHRTSRHEVFAPAAMGLSGNRGTKKGSLHTVEYFLSSSKRIDSCVCLGLLAKFQENQFFLEDPTGILKLDISEAKYQAGLYTENCFVLVEGFYEDSVFHVNSIGLPPAETSKSSYTHFNNVNVFGGPSPVSLKTSSKLLKYEKDNPDDMIVFISDVWLDDRKVMDKLWALFRGYSEVPPVAFVLMGNFLSSQYRNFQSQTLKSKFKALADELVAFPELINKSKFIFVPGPVDCGAVNILPRPPLPEWVTEEFRKVIPSAVFTTNPCRIQYCTKEIVVIREDIVTKMCRNTINFPTAGNIHDHFGKTIVCQAHLAPLPLNVCPMYWSYDTALRLFPLPDLVVTGDKFAPFTTQFMECQIINPGSFARCDFSFKVYVPAQQQVEDSQIPDE
ncbi:hypothetical protein R5R35_006489 [Gryllus longicercus]|uniref:DNA polymerase epsilon subunit n=1 Tax=Gryllus longicercus TaxID=2509291 RepID=A0AAN9V7U4_9ORTH